MPVSGGAPRWTVLLVLVLALAGAVAASLAFGAKHIPFGEVADGLFAPDGSENSLIVRGERLPRTILGIAVGTALGSAGALMQALTRNPLAEPGLLGVNSGAALAVVLVIGVLRVDEALVYVWAALAGAAVTAVLVYLLGAGGGYGATPTRLVLAGVAVNAVAAGVTAGVMLLVPRAFNGFRFWQVGSLGGQGLDVVWRILPFLLAGLLLALLLAEPLNTLALGDEAARSLGGRPGLIRAAGGLAIVLLCGGATAAAGPLFFIGLAVPFAARALAGTDHRWILAYSAFLAPVLLLGADVLGRLLGSPGELETGLVTAFLGAPLFILIVRRGKATRL
ncbi:iron chelate uptake ABC transporter family permease subunit [Actinocorallia sp. B10E7]|uniref:FecCD family ABC transporter permease n=1 Tax=Actinocorallia sp. B10E7 TaxID=3153558 RepID=UPI00325D6282